jgi:hypothetical protein
MVGAAGANNTEVVAFGGEPTRADAILYNGTSWTSTASMGTARYSASGAGTQPAGLAFGGGPGTKTNTEEFTGPVVAINTITTTD